MAAPRAEVRAALRTAAKRPTIYDNDIALGGDAMQPDPHGPLHGVRVLDASRVLAGPLCGQILGDLGADVLKVERPGAGDDTRAWGPPFAGALSAYYLSCNRNKRGLTLDLAHEEGVRIFQ